MDPADDEAFARSLCALLEEFGAAPGEALTQRVLQAVANLQHALRESARDGASLSALDVVRIRANKLFASSVPAAVYRDAKKRASAQLQIRRLARAWLGADSDRGSFFESDGQLPLDSED